jgi:hypothetical protein
MKFTHKVFITAMVCASAVVSQQVTVDAISRDPRNFNNVTVQGVFSTGNTKCTMVACRFGSCCNSCTFDSLRFSDGSGSIDVGPVETSPLAVKFFRSLQVSECHPKNLRLFSSIYSLKGSGGVLMYSMPNYSESSLFFVSHIQEVNRSLLYMKDTLFLDKNCNNSIDNSIEILNPSPSQVSIDSIFTDTLELTDKVQGIQITVTDISGTESTIDFKVTELQNKSHKYQLVPIDNRVKISIKSGEWVTLSRFKYTSEPGGISETFSSLPALGATPFDHPSFSMKLMIKNSNNETQTLLLKYAELFTSAIKHKTLNTGRLIELQNTASYGLNGRRVMTPSYMGVKVVNSGIVKTVLRCGKK